MTFSAGPPATPAGGAYIRTAEAAKILRRSPKTVSRWARDGRLPHLVTLGGHRRFPAAAVNELARQLGIK
jgi:excisionase family DNA binding protein